MFYCVVGKVFECERSTGKCVRFTTKNNFIHSSSNRLITAIGLKDTHVIDTPDALMIVNSDETQNVKKLVSELKVSQRKETAINRSLYLYYKIQKLKYISTMMQKWLRLENSMVRSSIC